MTDTHEKSINLRNKKLVEEYVERFSSTKEPIVVKFRDKFPELNYSDRLSHLIHSYPAKLLVHIPYFFINNSYFSKKGDCILDPFCGTGTVLLESSLAGRHAFGADANPLARLITEVKTTPLKKQHLEKQLEIILKTSRRFRKIEIPEVVNRDYWFTAEVQISLAKLLRSINEIKNKKTRNFFLVCLSNCVKKVSFADLGVSVPVKLNAKRFPAGSPQRKNIVKRIKTIKTIDVFFRFETICKENIERISAVADNDKLGIVRVFSSDARRLCSNSHDNTFLKPGSIKLIITSPPYAGAQKYIRASSLNLGWLGLCSNSDLKILDSQNIGRENYNVKAIKTYDTGISSADSLIKKIYEINPKRAAIVSNYLIEMAQALDEMAKVLRKNGHLVLIIGNNKVCNFEFNTQQYLCEYLERLGFRLLFKLIDDIKSYGLMTKRNKTADIISREWVLVFKK